MPIISRSFDRFGWTLVYCWDVLVWWTSCSFYLGPLNIQRREPYLRDFFEKNFDVDLYSDIHRSVSFKLGVMKVTTKLYIWYQFGWHWPSFKVTVVWEIKNIGVHLLRNSLCCQKSVGVLKLLLNLFCTSNIHGRELCWHFVFNVCLTLCCVRTLVKWFVSNLVRC